jgi:hypothetical protein
VDVGRGNAAELVEDVHDLALASAQGGLRRGGHRSLLGRHRRVLRGLGEKVAKKTASCRESSIAGAFEGQTVTINCKDSKKPYYAYVYPTRPYEIFVCRYFFSAPNLGRDSKAGTLVHEMSHFNVTAGTDDIVYGESGALNLAATSPNDAIRNADNHEYFAEDH